MPRLAQSVSTNFVTMGAAPSSSSAATGSGAGDGGGAAGTGLSSTAGAHYGAGSLRYSLMREQSTEDEWVVPQRDEFLRWELPNVAAAYARWKALPTHGDKEITRMQFWDLFTDYSGMSAHPLCCARRSL